MSSGTSAASRAVPKTNDMHFTVDSSRDKPFVSAIADIQMDETAMNNNTATKQDIDMKDKSNIETKPSKQKYVHPKPYREILGYKFIKTLGQGSMGKVKLAQHSHTKELIAVKIIPRYPKEWTSKPRKKKSGKSHGLEEDDDIPPEVDYDPKRDLRILREAFTLKLLDHPSIVRFIDFIMTEDHYYLMFEYVAGKSLLDYVISNGRLSEDRARNVLRQIIGAVDYCHHNSIVHRDLKVENIMIEETTKDENGLLKRLSTRRKSDGKEGTSNLRVKVLDFGLANYFNRDRLLATFCGSLYFAAPELLQAQRYTGPEVDIWSLGVIAFVLLCGQVPFDDGNLSVLHSKIKSGKVQYPPYLSPACVKFLKRLLCVDPKLRASMEEIKTHPWLQGVSDIQLGVHASTTPGNPFVLNDPPPFLLSTLGDKFRYLKFGGSHGPAGGAVHLHHQNNSYATTSSSSSTFSPYPLDIYLPKRSALKKLSGHHPNPVIVALLKRNPFDAVELNDPANNTHLQFSNADGSPVQVQFNMQLITDASKQMKKNINLREPTSFGFSEGFGFNPEEVDEVLKKAMKTDVYYEHSIMAIYNLMHEWMQKHAGKPIQQRPVTTPSNSLPSLIPTLQEDIRSLDVVPQTSDLYGSAHPRKITDKSMHSSGGAFKNLSGLWSSRNPQEICDQFYVILNEEGFNYAANGKVHGNLRPSGFLSEWVWKPSLIVSTANQEKLFKSIQFQLEWVQILSDDKRPGMFCFGIRCMRKSGDQELFERVWERVKWRWDQWLQAIN